MASRADEFAEERVRPVRAAAELGVELDADEEGVVPQLHDLDEAAVRRDAAGDQPGLGQLLAVGVVELEAVAVAFATSSIAVGRCGFACRATSRQARGRAASCRPFSMPRWSGIRSITGCGVSGRSRWSWPVAGRRRGARTRSPPCAGRSRGRSRGRRCSRAKRAAAILPSVPRGHRSRRADQDAGDAAELPLQLLRRRASRS